MLQLLMFFMVILGFVILEFVIVVDVRSQIRAAHLVLLVYSNLAACVVVNTCVCVCLCVCVCVCDIQQSKTVYPSVLPWSELSFVRSPYSQKAGHLFARSSDRRVVKGASGMLSFKTFDFTLPIGWKRHAENYARGERSKKRRMECIPTGGLTTKVAKVSECAGAKQRPLTRSFMDRAREKIKAEVSAKKGGTFGFAWGVENWDNFHYLFKRVNHVCDITGGKHGLTVPNPGELDPENFMQAFEEYLHCGNPTSKPASFVDFLLSSLCVCAQFQNYKDAHQEHLLASVCGKFTFFDDDMDLTGVMRGSGVAKRERHEWFIAASKRTEALADLLEKYAWGPMLTDGKRLQSTEGLSDHMQHFFDNAELSLVTWKNV
jgi:hypothetical protein